MSMSFRDCVFLYDTIGGCRKIKTLSFSWFWIKYQFFINSISLKFGASGLYLVTKGEIFSHVLGFSCKATLLLSKFTSVKVLI